MDDVGGEGAEVETFATRALASSGWFHLFLRPDDIEELELFRHLGPVTRRLLGRRMRTWPEVMDEFMTAWQFTRPCSEGCSPCFNDGIGDLYLTWPTDTGFVMVITEPEQVFAGEDPGDVWDQARCLEHLVSTLRLNAEWYAVAEDREPDDILARGALSFDVVLVTDAEHRDEVVRLWRAAGAPLD